LSAGSVEAWNARANPWVPAEERTPEFYDDDVPVIAAFDGGTVGAAVYCGEGLYLHAITYGRHTTLVPCTDDITHWMPMPEAPKEE